MRYLSVCSGIEAASVAWAHLGWTPVGFSEIEPFPSAVLAHRFPNVRNYGDMTNYETWDIEPGSVAILVGGTPCQSFSVAGLRRGLHDPRGGLMLTYLEIARRLRPKWIVWENVPGVLSSNGGRDFGSLLGALGELGYGWAYRVLDAQWVRTRRYPRAVPQRRRRVFVVGCAGDWRGAAAVLFERQNVRRDSAPRGKAREGAAGDAESCAQTGSAYVPDTCGTLSDGAHMGGGLNGQDAYSGRIIVPFRKSKRAQSVTDDESWVEAETANTINRFDVGERDTHAVAFHSSLGSRDGDVFADGSSPTVRVGSSSGGGRPSAVAAPSDSDESPDDVRATVRRLTPRECERLQGFPDDWTLIPWRGRPAEDCPDGPRYRALGNSMATNCMEWIGERVADVNRRM